MQHVAPNLFRPADKQAISLLDITAPARLVEPSLAEKVRAAVAVVKGLLQAGKHLVAASSFGKDSSVMVALALRAMEELQAEGFSVPELHFAPMPRPKRFRYGCGSAGRTSPKTGWCR